MWGQWKGSRPYRRKSWGKGYRLMGFSWVFLFAAIPMWVRRSSQPGRAVGQIPAPKNDQLREENRE